MHVSEALKLRKRQPELDFVDIDLSTDVPLFLDPAAFYTGQGSFAEDCSRDLEGFSKPSCTPLARKTGL